MPKKSPKKPKGKTQEDKFFEQEEKRRIIEIQRDIIKEPSNYAVAYKRKTTSYICKDCALKIDNKVKPVFWESLDDGIDMRCGKCGKDIIMT